MKLSVVIAAVLGLVLATGLIAYFGVGAVLTALVAIGWAGFAVFVGYGLIVYLVLGGAWWSVGPGQGLGRIRTFIWGRMVRESASEVLPLSALGGVVIGARALAVRGVDPTLAKRAICYRRADPVALAGPGGPTPDPMAAAAPTGGVARLVIGPKRPPSSAARQVPQGADHARPSPARSALHLRQRDAEGSRGRERLERTRSGARGARLYARESLAQPLGVPARSR